MKKYNNFFNEIITIMTLESYEDYFYNKIKTINF